MGELVRDARTAACKEREDACKRRQKQWRDCTRTQWASKPGEVYDLLKDLEHNDVSMLLRSDGTLTNTAQEVDALLRQEWLPIFQLYMDSPPPNWDRFEQRFGAHIPARIDMPDAPLTPLRLKETLRRMKTSASTGAGGWTVGELRQLPGEILQLWCDFSTSWRAQGIGPRL